jgi:hypothetical protein
MIPEATNHLTSLRCDPELAFSLEPPCAVSDNRGVFTEKERQATEVVREAHGRFLYVAHRSDDRNGVFDCRESEEPEIEGLIVFPTTVAGSILRARHGTRCAALIPNRGPTAKKRKENEAKRAWYCEASLFSIV